MPGTHTLVPLNHTEGQNESNKTANIYHLRINTDTHGNRHPCRHAHIHTQPLTELHVIRQAIIRVSVFIGIQIQGKGRVLGHSFSAEAVQGHIRAAWLRRRAPHIILSMVTHI